MNGILRHTAELGDRRLHSSQLSRHLPCLSDCLASAIGAIGRVMSRQATQRSIASDRADSGGRVSIVEFESHDKAAAWRKHPEHLEAQRIGRERFYAEHRGLVCTVERTYEFSVEE